MNNWFPRLIDSADNWETIESSEQLAGTASWSFTAQANLSVTTNIATIDGTGDLAVPAQLAGSSSWSFNAQADLSVITPAAIQLAGTASWSFVAQANLSVATVTVPLAGTASWAFTAQADLSAATNTATLAGTASWSFTTQADLSVITPNVVELSGTASWRFTTSGNLSTINPQIQGSGSSFELRREGRVWLEYANNFYLLHTTREVSFSQAFKQSSTTRRTLHSLNSLFDGSVINEANPADFSFELFLINNDNLHQHLPLELLLAYNGNTLNTFNLYFTYLDNNPEVFYKVENCVFTNGTFNIPRIGIMSVSLSGQGTKLTRTTSNFTGIDAGYSLNADIAVSKEILITVGDQVLSNVLGVSLEVSNEIDWLANNTLQRSLATTNASNSTFPQTFVLTGRTVAGSIQQYVNDASSLNLQTWQENTTVRIRAGSSASSICLDVNMANACSFTNRLNVGELFSQNYDFRLMTSPSDLRNYFSY